MDRRGFIKSAFALYGTLASRRGAALSMQTAPAPVVPNLQVKRVLIMFKCHFDAGFIDTQAARRSSVLLAILSPGHPHRGALRQSGDARYVWTTGSWLLYEYLEQASPEDRRRMEQAISQRRHRLARPPFQLADRDDGRGP